MKPGLRTAKINQGYKFLTLILTLSLIVDDIILYIWSSFEKCLSVGYGQLNTDGYVK